MMPGDGRNTPAVYKGIALLRWLRHTSAHINHTRTHLPLRTGCHHRSFDRALTVTNGDVRVSGAAAAAAVAAAVWGHHNW